MNASYLPPERLVIIELKMPTSQRVKVEYTGSIAIITLDHPQKLNVLTKDDFYQLATYLNQIADREDILITLLIGKGKYFSA